MGPGCARGHPCDARGTPDDRRRRGRVRRGDARATDVSQERTLAPRSGCGWPSRMVARRGARRLEPGEPVNRLLCLSRGRPRGALGRDTRTGAGRSARHRPATGIHGRWASARGLKAGTPRWMAAPEATRSDAATTRWRGAHAGPRARRPLTARCRRGSRRSDHPGSRRCRSRCHRGSIVAGRHWVRERWGRPWMAGRAEVGDPPAPSPSARAHERILLSGDRLGSAGGSVCSGAGFPVASEKPPEEA